MTTIRPSAPTALRVLTAALTLVSCGCAPSASASRHAVPVLIAGEFRADGTCSVTADSVPVFSEGERPRTIYLRNRALNMAPAGLEVHEIWCAPITASEPMLPDQPAERAFFVNVYVPPGRLASAQRYVVRSGIPSAAAAALGANISLFGLNSDSTDPGMTYLAGVVGEVVLTSVDSARVVGSARAIALPERTM